MPKPIYCLCAFGGKTKTPILHKEKAERLTKKKTELKRRQNNPNLEPPGMICGAEWSREMKN